MQVFHIAFRDNFEQGTPIFQFENKHLASDDDRCRVINSEISLNFLSREGQTGGNRCHRILLAPSMMARIQ